MANKYERRRRALKDLPPGRENPYASPRFGPRIAAQPEEPGGRRAGRGVVVTICCLLVLSTVAVFLQTRTHGFVNCDDNEYVYANHFIQQGLTPSSAWWAITQAHSANWHPLTWMSHTLDWQLFGKWDADRQCYVDSWPGGHHLVNVLLHAVNAVLLYLVLQSMTGATWPSAAVAALFAVHPLRVESVAWVTGRKDLLSGLFFLLTLWAYQAYAMRPFSWWRYGLVILAFGLGLTAKPMLVTMPFVLLLLDFWPLERIAAPQTGNAATFSLARWVPPRVILDKIPMLALSAGSSMLTMWAQGLVMAYKPLEFQYRVGNAICSYGAFLGQMFFPVGMVVQYVHPGPSLRLEDTLIPLTALVSITMAVLSFGWRRRYLAVGWFWFLGMLVPVIGLVQVGAQARADRYTYLTQIGLYIMIAWGLGGVAKSWRGRIALYASLAVPVLAVLTAIAWGQTTHWRNSLTLWEHCVACQPKNDFAQNSYGNALNEAGRAAEAKEHFEEAVECNPKYLTPRTNIAAYWYKQGKLDEALKVCDEALKVDSDDTTAVAEAHAIRAVVLYAAKRTDESIHELQIAIAMNPKNSQARGNLAEVLRAQSRYDEALAECNSALEINPDFAEGHRTKGNILLAKHDPAGAAAELQFALKLKPDDLLAYDSLFDALWQQGKFTEAAELRKQQAASQPPNVAIGTKFIHDLISDPRPAARFGQAAVEIGRRLCDATGYQEILSLDALAAAYAEVGDFDQAEATVRKAMETPQGHKDNNPKELQKRLFMYHSHQKLTLPLPKNL
jgi:protein O-mannosyl-transferase